jgi:hypothetical protein
MRRLAGPAARREYRSTNLKNHLEYAGHDQQTDQENDAYDPHQYFHGDSC